LSTNAVKTRINRLISNGIIREFVTSINIAVFGYSKVCHLTVRDGKSKEETLSRIKLFGRLLFEMDCVGGLSIFGIAIKKDEEEKIQLLPEAIKPAFVHNCVLGQYSSVGNELKETDYKIIKCLMSNPRMEIFEIARRISVSSKTVSGRLARLKEKRMLKFFVSTDPEKMQGYVRFGMIIKLERKTHHKSIRQIQEVLDKNFDIAFPIITQEDMISCQLVARSLFEIDPALKKIESLEGVKGAEVFIPSRIKFHQDWIQREIDHRASSMERIVSILR